ncbi:DUF2635 domain-containing protein [Oleidesulfovibrio alaskensis]|jgi:hypothetical protein|uniref:DUF2635 domain-containing protein n=1 Tax=Oleidesulfovibrio alaskensis TaxID=58180 RepID=UPI00040FCCAC|nr:DUF2635 domain-containing protein [Oleidesulfovibrio alaskensis]
MLVQAVRGVRVPAEDTPRRHIDDSAPVEVPDTAYYRRRMADGDLVEVADVKSAASVPKTVSKEARRGKS